MMKVVFFGLLVVGALATSPSFEDMKNIKTADIKQILENMTPEMMEMAKNMGVSKEQLDEAVNNLPEEDMSAMFKNMGENTDELKSQMKEMIEKESVGAFKEEMKNMGIDLSEGPEGLKDQLLPKIKEMIEQELRRNGVDIDNPEELRRNVMAEIRMMVDAKEDTSDEEVREMIKGKITEEMKQDGVEFDQADIKGDLKKQVMGHMKEMGIDMENGLDKDSLKNMMKNMIKSEF